MFCQGRQLWEGRGEMESTVASKLLMSAYFQYNFDLEKS